MTPTLVSIYETDEGILVALCDRCAKDFYYQWVGYAEDTQRCSCCKELNAVDATRVEDYWTDVETWHAATDNLLGGPKRRIHVRRED